MDLTHFFIHLYSIHDHSDQNKHISSVLFFFFAENFENWAEKECFVLVYFHLIVYQPQKQLPSAVNDMTLFYWA